MQSFNEERFSKFSPSLPKVKFWTLWFFISFYFRSNQLFRAAVFSKILLWQESAETSNTFSKIYTSSESVCKLQTIEVHHVYLLTWDSHQTSRSCSYYQGERWAEQAGGDRASCARCLSSRCQNLWWEGGQGVERVRISGDTAAFGSYFVCVSKYNVFFPVRLTNKFTALLTCAWWRQSNPCGENHCPAKL